MPITARLLITRIFGAALLVAFSTGALPAQERISAPAPMQAQKRPSAFSVSTSSGFARIVIVFPGEAKAEAEIADGVLSIALPRTITMKPQRLPQYLAGYVLSASRDGDVLRLVLARKVTVNAMAAGEKLFVDLLPETWTGRPPGLPKEVIADLARKARASARATEKIVSAPASAVGAPPPTTNPAPIVAALRREGDVLKVAFPFDAGTSAALFRLGNAVWAVFDTMHPIEFSALGRDVELIALPSGRALRIPLDPMKQVGVEARGTEFLLVIGEAAAGRMLALDRIMTLEGRAAAFLPLAGASRVHRLRDPESGEAIIAVTAPLPARGSPRALFHVDFRLLPSAHGIALVPQADDLEIKIAPDGVSIARPGGLTITDDGTVAAVAEPARPFGALAWQVDREARFRPRESELVAALAAAEPGDRTGARIALARFYLAGAAEDVAVAFPRGTGLGAAAKADFFALRGLARLMLQRPREAIEDLMRPALANSGEAALIRAAALAAGSQFAEAREAFRTAEKELPALPAELQRLVRMAALRTAIETEAFDEAGALLKALEAREPLGGSEPKLAVLAGRLAMRLGVSEQAAAFFAAAEQGPDQAAAAEAALYRIELAQARGEIDRIAAVKQLELLAQSWRGDETEFATRRLIGRLYAGDMRERNLPTGSAREAARIP